MDIPRGECWVLYLHFTGTSLILLITVNSHHNESIFQQLWEISQIKGIFFDTPPLKTNLD